MWKHFETTNDEDDTINNLFCSKGLFKITSDVEILSTPKILAIIQHQKIVLAIGRSLVLVENENASECNFLQFGSDIDVVTVSQCGGLILCALQDGNIHGIHTKAGVPLLNLTIKSEDVINSCDKRTFIGIHQLRENFYIMCATGTLYKLSNIDDKILSETLTQIDENETCEFNESLLLNATLEKLPSTRYRHSLNSFCLVHNKNPDYIVIASVEEYLIIRKNNCDFKIKLPSLLEGAKQFYNLESSLIALSNSGKLFEICPFTYLVFTYKYDETFLIDDLIVLENTNEEIELLIISKTNNNGTRLMRIIQFPSMQCINELIMQENVWLVQQPKSSVNMYFVSGKTTLENQFYQEIEMKIITETNPEQRLKKLLQKGHIQDAEDYAKKYSLNQQPIQEAKVKRIIIECKQFKQFEMFEEKFNDLLQLLQQINDKNYLSTLLYTEIPERNFMAALLEFLLEKLNNDENYTEYVQEINERLLRLETLKLIDPYDCNLDWIKFIYQPNLLKICKQLCKEDLTNSGLVWARHSSSILPYIDEKIINSILDTIPMECEPVDIIHWLKHFVPCVVQYFPNIMSTLVDWCIKRASTLQFSNLWPEIGLEFISNIFTIFNDINFFFVDIRRQYENNLQKIQHLINSLNDLSILKREYFVSLTLDEYNIDSDETAFFLLRRIGTTNIKNLINNFIFPIYIKKGLSPIPSIIKYIHYLVAHQKRLAEWQNRAVVTIDLLHNETEKLKCILLILKQSPVPWSETIQPLIKYGLINHPLANDIFIEYKLQIIKLLKVKYDWPIDANNDYMKLIFRIMKVNHPEMIEDLKNLVKAVPSISVNGNFYCGYELARNGYIEIAINFINNLEEKHLIECCQMTINILTKKLDEELAITPSSKLELDNLKEYLLLVSNRHPILDKNQLIDLLKILQLRDTFEIHHITLETFHKIDKKTILNLSIKNFIKKLKQEGSGSMEKIWCCVNLISKTLELNNMIVILEMTKQLDNIILSCNLALLILEFIDINKYNYEYVIEFSLYLIVQQTNNETQVIFGDPLVYPLAFRLIKENINYFESNTLIHWIRIVNDLYDFNIIEKETKNINEMAKNVFCDFFNINESTIILNKKIKKRDSLAMFDQQIEKINEIRNNIQCDTKPIMECIGLALKVLIIKFHLIETPFNKLNILFNIKDCNETEVIDSFFCSLEHLLKIKQHSCAFFIIQNMLKYQNETSILLMPTTFVVKVYKRMLKHVLLQKEPNYIDALSILFSTKDPQNVLTDIKEDLKGGCLKVNILSFSEMFYTLIGDKRQVLIDKEERLKYYYCLELCKSDSSLKSNNNFDFISIPKLTKELKNKILDVDLLKQMSIDFQWDLQEVLITQIITVLKLQSLKFDVKTDVFGKEEIIIQTSSNEILNLCQPYINEITNTSLLSSYLLSLLKEINFYFYELYLCIIQILSLIERLPNEMKLWREILLFLKFKMTTRRHNRAGQIETDWWLKSQLENGVLPKIAKYRFPFQPIIVDPLKNILDGEINIENCEKWFTLIKLHAVLINTNSPTELIKLQDYFCMSAVKNSIVDYKAMIENPEIETWHLKPVNNAFLLKILQITTHMIETSKIICILYFVSNHAPEGADQVEAAFECYKVAIKHEKEFLDDKKTHDIITKIKRKYPILKTQHLLHLYGLNEEKLFELVENSNELINALYNHDCVLKTNRPDINKIAMEIATLHNLNFESIQYKLLQKWLDLTTDTDEGGELDETYYEEFNPTSNNCTPESDNLNEDHVKRAHFILSTWKTEKAIEFLIHIFSSNQTTNTGRQLQVFECITKLINDTNLSYIDIINQNEFINLKCIHHLKQLGYNFTIHKFKEYNKINLIKQIWKKKAGDENALEVISYICLGFDIFIPQIWNGVLKQMVNLHMFEQLSSLVVILSVKSSLLHITGLVTAWEYVIKSLFKNANNARLENQEALLCKSLILLQTCPIASKLNLVELAERCVCLSRPHMAAILIIYAKTKQKKVIIELIQQHMTETIKTDIEELEHHGIAQTITKFVINELKL